MTEYIIGKRYKWSPWVHGTNLWKDGILSSIENKKGRRIGVFITRSNETWEIPLDDEYCNVKPYK